MVKLNILTFPDPLLKQMSIRVDNFDTALSRLLDDMAETMYDASGIGLAAPQVGVLQRVAVVDLGQEDSELREFVNPQIVWRSGTTPSEEGCLSIPDYRDTVKRDKEIVVQAQDRGGREFETKADGLLAICLQHEIDHLDGILFVDRLSRIKREMFRRWHQKRGQGE